VNEVFATRRNWLLAVTKLAPLDVVTIHPLEDLTPKMIVAAMGMQGLFKTATYKVVHHGTRIFVQREQSPDAATGDPT
jgi:hypothetical protein